MDYFNQPLADSLDDQKRKQDGSTNNEGTNPFGESDQSSSSLFGSDNTASQPENNQTTMGYIQSSFENHKDSFNKTVEDIIEGPIN